MKILLPLVAVLLLITAGCGSDKAKSETISAPPVISGPPPGGVPPGAVTPNSSGPGVIGGK